MAEQISRRSNLVTSAPFDQPFETHTQRFGAGSLNLKDSLDAMEGWARHTNVWHENEGEAVTRPGETVLATHGGTAPVHSIRTLRDPGAGSATRFWGVGSAVHRGVGDSTPGVTTPVDSGYSGDPLTFVPHRPPLSSEPWMFVADRSRMQKIRSDGLSLPIGLPAPDLPATALASEYSRVITMCDATDGTEAATWVPASGTDVNGVATGTPDAAVDTEGPIAGSAIYLVTAPGDAVDTAYDSWWGCPFATPRDLTTLTNVDTPGAPETPDIDASDDDILHLWMKTSHPQLMAEIRLYIVCSEVFDPLVLPGTPPPDDPPAPPAVFTRRRHPDTQVEDAPRPNQDAYVKAFRPNDYVQFVQANLSQIEAAEQARVYALRDKDSQTRGTHDTRSSWADLRSQSDPDRARSYQLGLGHQQWFGWGLVGSALRRGDFQRIGSTSGRDWSTITGVIIYVRTLPSGTGPIAIGLDDVYITGGRGLDTCEPGVQQYDYRVTHYDPRTGAESNGSDTQLPSTYLDSVRRAITITPVPYSTSPLSAIRQRIYRRGGTNIDDWFFVGENDADGGAFLDTFSDLDIALAGTLPDDHFQPVPTVASNGDTVLAQPVAALFGPLEGMLFACGDPHRPGFLYHSVTDEPDHWSAFGTTEVCAPSEELMHGGLLGSQGFVFSRLGLYFIYPNLGGPQGVTTAPSHCTRGLNLSRWAFTAGPAGVIFFVAEDGIFATDGGPEQWLSEAINPLFYGTAVNGYTPIDKSPAASDALRLTVWENCLYFQYQDTSGNRQVLVYSLLQKFWRHYHFAKAPATLQGQDEPVLLLGGLTTGASYLHSGTSDDGAPIDCVLRTGAVSGGRREEKLFGDLFLDAAPGITELSVQVFLNEETHANSAIPVTSALAGRQRFLLHAFGESPQKAHSISAELRWSTLGAGPTLYQLGVGLTLQPELTNTRVTNWDDLNSPDEVWLSGVTFDCDTGGAAKDVFVERDFAGTRDTVATLTALATGRHKLKFSWPAVPAHMVRLRPDAVGCAPWLLYRADWIYVSEPPRIAHWDIHFENRWDQYHTGLDLYCDTFGATKQIEVWVDEERLVNTLGGGLTYWPITTNGRRVVHLTLPWGRGHVYRFFAIDDHEGLLYTHRWHLQEEPSEQANWNQNFSILGTHADKWLKAIIFECDTYGVNKSVQVEVDGAVVETITVNATGRSVIQRALADQQLGRVWRMFPVDGNPGRLYSAEPIFDEEPFCFDRWETQETNHGLPGWFYPLYGHLTLKSSAEVTLRTVMQHNQVGGTTTYDYVIPATGNQKQRRFLNGFHAGKGVLIKYLLTSPVPFWLYRDETAITIQPWGAYQSIEVKPFGNDDLDPARPMAHAILAAQSSGGSVAPGQTG